ncbi:CheR family methyltransferase [Pinibacter soli]|uniref:histidine kinase n=1 Tax=Pinibacter soli TaxID=3044211 RepID=A0ABT6RE83_9BACT|nr:CheR family methyltransferase [Pinibacter soli]MDI3320885.1 CheR family methyltransferase [Pinibacter soli]
MSEKGLDKNKTKQFPTNGFPVVGVGASAGGLEAFKKLIKAIPETSGMAYILVQHLEPTHESKLAELLQKISPVPIYEITNNIRVEPDRIYIIPSNKLLTATDGVLQLSPRPAKNEKNMPIDVFFTSLAEIHGSQAIGIVLSGTATDGTIGLKAIKEQGGITIAQDPKSAAYDGMPQNAIDSDVVDFVFAPEEIPLQLTRLVRSFQPDFTGPHEKANPNGGDAFRQLLAILHARRGADFTYYKQTTIRRRIIRRMGLNNVENITDYLSFVKENIQEQDLLYQDLLIPVTSFFRDTKTFDFLCDTIFPLLLRNKAEAAPLRIWVAGCSTGEEVYSMAICLYEYFKDKAIDDKIQIFATDISEKAITKARTGTYSQNEITSLTPARLQKYFTKWKGNFQIDKSIRDICVFACHNFLKDPPFAKIDLISCRNVLIYMEPSLQKRVLTTFHYAIKDNGYLLLGKSESVSPASDLFAIFGKNEKVYIRKPAEGKYLNILTDNSEFKKNNIAAKNEFVQEDFQKSADDILLSRYTPAGVVINDQMEIVQFRGATGNWLEPSSGKPTLNVLKMAREGLAFELRNALHKVKVSELPIVKENIPMQFMGKMQWVTIEVVPLLNTAEPYFLILFKESMFPRELSNAVLKLVPSADPDQQNAEALHIQRLQMELAQTREDMRSITEDQEAVNEELQSANEELLSGSEELQSLNEELQSTKEEIQSTNEELTILNQELFDRNEQLNIARLYAESIIATIREPLIVLDKNMNVKTANRSYYQKFRTTENETEGKSFYELEEGQWNIPYLRSMLKTVLLEGKEMEDFEIRQVFKYSGERIMLLNATQIFRKKDAEQLILLVVEDVTDMKKQEAQLKKFTLELEEKVEERTLDLKNSNESLKHSNENLEQYASIASHDLQEPLRKIRAFASLLNQRYSGDIKDEAKQLLKKISLSADRMSTLITDVLSYSKIVESKLVFEQTDLNKVIEDVIADFDLLIFEKNASITYKKLPMIDAVPLQINQLFYNLLSNALKFSNTNIVPVISITSNALAEADMEKYPDLNSKVPYVEIIFRDNGIGFDQKFSEQIFLIFQRLNSREQFEGTGIGLALCKKIVVLHHGEIYAEAKEGQGTIFHIILPLKQLN